MWGKKYYLIMQLTNLLEGLRETSWLWLLWVSETCGSCDRTEDWSESIMLLATTCFVNSPSFYHVLLFAFYWFSHKSKCQVVGVYYIIDDEKQEWLEIGIKSYEVPQFSCSRYFPVREKYWFRYTWFWYNLFFLSVVLHWLSS